MDNIDDNEYQRYREPKMCFLPTCKNNDIKNPEKKFFCIRKELKENWCDMAKRNCPKRRLYCCEDHINVEEDLENYNKWICGMKPRLKLNATLKNIPYIATNPTSSNIRNVGMSSTSDVSGTSVIETAHSADVGVQCDGIVAVANKYVMVKPTTEEKTTNFRAQKTKHKIMPSLMSHLPDSDETPSQSSYFFGTSHFESTSSSSARNYDDKSGREHIMKTIKNKPEMYIGVPKNFLWIVDFIAQQCLCITLHIIMTLFKLKTNDTFERMSEEFEMAQSTIRMLFQKNVVILATYFQNFIYLPTPTEIKKNIPLVFKIRYSYVQCIIDCFEIQIQKPSDPIKQAQTWSQYKSCNTVKYLIGCTPDGFISFISEGFGGRISNKAITQKSGFIDILPSNAVIMADRGFKEIESLLSSKNIKLLRPSDFTNKPLTKTEVTHNKVIASLREHIERVIRRVREFQMLKPHSVINNKHLTYLDQLVTVACGLINLQDPIIKHI